MSFVRILLGLALLASIGWLAVAGYYCWQTWPHVPLDVSAVDPATVSAHQNAVIAHFVRYAAVGLVPLFVVIVLRWLALRRS